MIKIICIGKKNEDIYADAISYFEIRLSSLTKFEWIILPHSSHEGQMAKDDESKKILSRLTPKDFVILFDEKGGNYKSEELAIIIDGAQTNSKDIVCVIGGSYGVNTEVFERSVKVLSIGTSVLPHQLMRLIICEQIYRACSINSGSKYHHA